MTYLVFYNKTGNRKLAVEFDENITKICDINEKLASILDAIGRRNDYTFAFYSGVDTKEVIKNLPVINVNSFI
jgi:hypothetical protein